MRWLAACLLAMLVAAPAQARWHEASSAHFVVYADDDPADIQRFAEMLERYHAALALLTGREVPEPSPSNRLTIFAVGTERDMSRLAQSRAIAGFYVPRAGRSRAFVPDIRVSNGDPDFSMTVLLHEYAHHFLISSSRFAMPRWLSEGAAEFFASAKFPRDGSISLGRAAQHRAGELFYADEIPVEALLGLGPDLEDAAGFYGRSWLLFHYLSFAEERHGQLERYWQAIASGTPSRQAGIESFGDLEELDRELARYLRQRRILTWNMAAALLPTKPVTVRAVSQGLGEMLPIAIVSQRGVSSEEALELLPRARRVAMRFPDDPDVLAALAEAEFDAGNDAEALAAANRALAINPAVENALVQKGYALFRLAETATDPDAAYREAMRPFNALNRLENDHPLPLIYFYHSFAARGAEPPEQARHALERAAQLAPFDQSLWFQAGLMQAGEGKISIARQSLAPLAADPHGGDTAQLAARLMAALAQAPEGERFDPSLVLAEQAALAVPGKAAVAD